ncbi:MAG: radical SAM protein, partial [Candidatus Aminicenantales bacterium]
EGSIAILHIYPGTPLEKLAREAGFLPRDFTWTRRRRKGVVTLPQAQGDVPLYVDRLTWKQISELVFRWSFSANPDKGLVRKAPQAFKHVRSFADFKRRLIMGGVYVRLRLGKRKGSRTQSPTRSAWP